MTSATIARPAVAGKARVGTRPLFRRLLVTIGVAGSLLIAGVTIRAASQWAATQAPLTIAPASVESLQAALDQERSRSADLQQQLAALQSSTAQLSSALLEAQSRAGVDQTTAQELKASLTAARARLTKLEASLAAAAKQAARTRSTSTTTVTTHTGGDDKGGPGDD